MDQQARGGPLVAFFGGSFDPPHLGHLGVARAAREALGLDTVLFAPVGTQPLKPRGTEAAFEDRLAMTRLAIAAEPGFALSLADAPKPSGAPNYTLETLIALRAQLPPGNALFCLMGADSFTGFCRWHRAAEIPFVAPLIVASRPGQPLDNLDSALPQSLSIEAVPAPDDLAEESYASAKETEGGGGFTGCGKTRNRTSFVSGHDFSRAVSASKQMRALAPEGSFSAKAIALRRYILRNPAGRQTPFYLLPGLHFDISASDIREQIRLSQTSPAASPAQNPHSALIPPPVLDYIRTHHLYR
jgi:nicotinate (nicotinamide) nucleotide adenylyltransferase